MIAIRVALILIVAVIATILGLMIAFDPGYVLVGFAGWELDTSIWAALAAALVIGISLRYLFKLIGLVLRGNTNLARWFSAKRHSAAQKHTMQAIEEETNGNGIEAVRHLVAAGSQSPNPVLHYLRASEIASRIGAHEKAAELLSDASKLIDNDNSVFSKFVAANTQLQENKPSGIHAMQRLLEENPRCAPALRAVINHSIEVADWEGALDYVTVLSRLSYVDEDEINELAARCWVGRMQGADEAELKKVWNAVPRKLKSLPKLISAHITALERLDQSSDAANEVARALKQEWVGEWVRAYGRFEGDARKQLSVAEQWQANHPDDPDLAIAVGRLHRRLDNATEARHHFERSVSLGGGLEAELELAEVQFETGSLELAKETLARAKNELATR